MNTNRSEVRCITVAQLRACAREFITMSLLLFSAYALTVYLFVNGGYLYGPLLRAQFDSSFCMINPSDLHLFGEKDASNQIAIIGSTHDLLAAQSYDSFEVVAIVPDHYVAGFDLSVQYGSATYEKRSGMIGDLHVIRETIVINDNSTISGSEMARLLRTIKSHYGDASIFPQIVD